MGQSDEPLRVARRKDLHTSTSTIVGFRYALSNAVREMMTQLSRTALCCNTVDE